MWRDFDTLAGPSSEWVTGYVCYATRLIECAEFDRIGVLKTLLHRQRRTGGWGYNHAVPTDSDSTAWAVLALSTANIARPSVLYRARGYLVAHRQSSGGFATYSDDDGIERYIQANAGLTAGWRSSHPCVTAVVLQALMAVGEAASADLICGGARFLAERQDDSGGWRAYWWKGHAYSTYHALRFLAMAGALPESAASKACALLERTQAEDGSWSGDGSGGDVFATSHAVLALLLRPGVGGRAAAQRGAEWLLRNQEPGGRWPSAPMLRIPPPMAENPDPADSWRIDDRGTGVVVRDRAGIFTTAASLWALSVVDRMGLTGLAGTERRRAS